MNLEERIGYTFHDKALLAHALRHSSYTNEQKMPKEENNERLEFLGDAVLELASSRFLFERYPHETEGTLTKYRASMVCESALAYCADRLELGKELRLGKGEAANGGRRRPSVTSDALEALIGAIFLDGGFASAEGFIKRHILTNADDARLFHDSKSILQEYLQAKKKSAPEYVVIHESGPDHDKRFTVEARSGDVVLGTGTDRSKKSAEQRAAYEAIKDVPEIH